MSVRNLEESVSFYSKIFGFVVKEDQPSQKSKIIGNEHIKLCMYEDPNLKIGHGLNHFGFYIENFEEIIEICKKNGVEIEYEGEVQWNNPAKSKSIYMVDTNGYTIELSNQKGAGL